MTFFRIPDRVINELSTDDDSDIYAEGAAEQEQHLRRLARRAIVFGLRDEDIIPDHEMEAAFGGEERMHELQKSH
jgi:hypothetical protein